MKRKMLCAVVIVCLISCAGIASPYGQGSADAASTWVEQMPAGDLSRNWLACASDATGQRLLAGDNGGRLWISSDAGASWAEASAPAGGSSRNWQACASDSDGSALIAAVTADGFTGRRFGCFLDRSAARRSVIRAGRPLPVMPTGPRSLQAPMAADCGCQ